MAAVTTNSQNMKFTKSEAEYNMKSIRFLLLTITSMFIVIGGLMIVIGISVYTHYHGFAFFYLTNSGRFLTPSVLCVFLGLLLLVVTSFGFFGSLKQSTCMVNLYATILTVILLIKLVVVILAFTMDQNTLMQYIYFPVKDYPYDIEIRNEIDNLQRSLNCCGSESYLDYVGMEFAQNQSTYITTETNQGITTVAVPQSCCAVFDHGDREHCIRLQPTSCSEALINMLLQNASVLGILGVSVMFIMFLGIVFALLLARSIRRLKSERAMMEWKIKEQMILARQEERRKAEYDQTVYIAQPESSSA